ncbi:hypothetical protein N6H14_16340 [Paenibacillus sp. CC-CFT747]|nr:hypothetical protein N6H14_16340 [Paenibacillus sp. CC-CFT747]
METETAWIAVVGTLGGAALTTLSTLLTSYLKTRNDNAKDIKTRTFALEDEKRKQELERREKEFGVYNEVLRLDGIFEFTQVEDTGLSQFRLDKYKEKVSPLLYKNLHLLDPNIIRIVRELDDYSDASVKYNTIEEWLDDMSGVYKSLIREIENQYAQIFR